VGLFFLNIKKNFERGFFFFFGSLVFPPPPPPPSPKLLLGRNVRFSHS